MSDAGNFAAPATRLGKALGRFRSWYRNALAGVTAPDELETAPSPSPGKNAILLAHPEAPLRLTVMMRRLGLQRDDVHDDRTLRELEFTCALCQDTGDCRHWLQSKETVGHHRFCPNARHLDRLIAQRK